MPEIAEVRLTSEFISKVGKSFTFTRLEKSPVSKVKTDLSVPYKTITVDSKSRGKELSLQLIGRNEIGQTGMMALKVTLGMSGHWVFYDPLHPENEKIHKHTHLRLYTSEGKILGLCDVRRFAKWSWSDFDKKGRGPCLFFQEQEFRDNLLNNWYTHRDFQRHKLSEIMMSQRWFNGVGNYLRAEILHRLDVDPFMKSSDLKKEDLKRLIDLTVSCCTQSYKLGGGQLKDWKNPSGEDPSSFDEWMQCYSRLEKTVDGTGRTFWFDKKWKTL
jgi:endonuclease VIII-like 1